VTTGTTTPTGSSTQETPAAGRVWALTLATIAFLVNFWAWGMISPLAPQYQAQLGLTPFTLSVLVAAPVLVGSLGRIPLGVLTDRYGGRLVFGVTTLVTIVPVLLMAVAGSFPLLLLGGLLLGIGGATFAIGVPFVNAWFPPHRRGLALGIYGMGNVGTAVANFASPRIAAIAGRPAAYLTVAVALAVVGVAFLLLARDAPNRTVSTEPFATRFRAALALPATGHLAALYAVTFGGFVAFGVYLPTYLQSAYGLDLTDAATRAAGFVLLATLARPVGGALADRLGGRVVVLATLATVAVMAVVVAFEPVMAVATPAFLIMAIALGAGSGAVFALLSVLVPGPQVGTVTGVVGAAGGLGGFLPPIVMGLVFQATDSYAIGLMLLSDVALAALVFAALRITATPRSARSAG
jgi:NNP family nitrate/nitrite transporter-like MFS transporter